LAYVPVPKDLTAVKTKTLFNLTKRPVAGKDRPQHCPGAVPRPKQRPYQANNFYAALMRQSQLDMVYLKKGLCKFIKPKR
jgi:hypothetical protein